MDKDEILAGYGAWLRRREYSPATIEKYTGALARFFAESAAQAAPGKEAVAAWRDSLAARGYTPATVNAMLAAVNDYQESIGNAAGKAKPLKRQRRVFCDADRELTRAEYFRLLAAARDSGNTRALLLLETICATGIRVSELVYITAEAVQCRRASNFNSQVIYTNTARPELPETGGSGTLLYTTGGTALLAAALLYDIRRRKAQRSKPQ